MENAMPFPVLAGLLALDCWVVLKMWLGLVVALHWLRLPPERPLFVRWLEEGLGLEDVGDGPGLNMAAGTVFVLATMNVTTAVILWMTPVPQPAGWLLSVGFYAVQVGWLVWLARYAAKARGAA